jgi:hypothetical protein
VKDAASLSIVNSSDRKKIEEQLVQRMGEIEKRLAELQGQAPATPNQTAQLSSPTRPQAPEAAK